VAYRKQYPGGDETARFLAGPCPEAIEVDGWRLGLAICRDTGVARHPADTAALGIDAYVAGATDHPADDVVMAERARRISTTLAVWVAFAGFAGPTGGGYSDTAGRSGIWAPDGSEVARAGRAPGELVTTTLTTRR
jgi:predicted amidohydrolase